MRGFRGSGGGLRGIVWIMAARLITYDLGEPEFEPVLLKYLADNKATMITESSYVLDTAKEPGTIVGEIRALTKDHANVYVVTIVWPYSGWSKTPSKELATMLPNPGAARR